MKVKRKGAYEYEDLGWHQNQSALIVPMAEKIVMELAAKSFVKASEYLKLRVTVTGSPAIGDNWEQIH